MVLTLLICRSPTIVIWILRSFEFTIKIFFDSSSSSSIRRFHTIANLIAIINAATNFLPFCVFGQLFRIECLNIYCCRTISNEQILQQTRKKYNENHIYITNNQRLIKENDNNQQRNIIINDNLRNNFILNSETTSSPIHSTSFNSSTNVIRLCDSPFHFSNYGQQYPKTPSVTTKIRLSIFYLSYIDSCTEFRKFF
ncbi:unnamed protein product [Rotaria sp. Silwood1]|nr:unnamed protein product [Rotaria sp. Silwood1]